jgi:hypothetical protein
VRTREVLRRIDSHMERIDAHMERGNELMAEIRGVIADQRQFNRELLLRFDRRMDSRDAWLSSFLEGNAERMRAEARATREAAEAARAERRAVVQGLLQVIERLGPGNEPAVT